MMCRKYLLGSEIMFCHHLKTRHFSSVQIHHVHVMIYIFENVFLCGDIPGDI